MQTMLKSSDSTIDSFAQESTLNFMRMFSRGFGASLNLGGLVKNDDKKSDSNTNSEKVNTSKNRQRSNKYYILK